jgi:type II secretory pathway component GspD/PulD (secretin)
MKNNFKLSVFIAIFFLCLFLPKSEAVQELKELAKDLPFPNPETLISMDFQDASLKDILKIFSIQSGLNFIASDAVKDRKFTLYFDGVPIKDAMDKIFKANNLSYELDKESNIFIVNDLGAPESQTITKIFRLKHASVVNSPMQYDKESIQVMGSSSGGGSGSGSGGSGSGSVKNPPVIDKASISKVVEKLLSDKGKLVEDYRTNSLIVTDVPTRMAVITEVITSLDIPQPQVLLEVEMLDVNKNLVDQIGVKWNTPIFDQTLTAGPTSWMTKWPQGSLFGDMTRNFTNGTVTLTNNASIRVIIDWLTTQVSTRYLARPRILTLNNETAEIMIVTNEAVGVVSTSTSTGGATGSTTASAERAGTGVALRVTPQINTDTNEITMFIVPAVGEATAGATYTIVDVGTIQFKDPEVRYTKSVVKMKDGDTIILGGLIRKTFSETTIKLPILGDLPFLGKFFTHRYKERDKDRELLVFITPHIIKDMSVQLAQAKKGVLPEREQSATSRVSRQAVIDASLKSFEKKKK